MYVFVGLFWLPVVWMQHQMRNLARVAVRDDTGLPDRYFQLFKWWFISGFPAFFGVLAILWLMIARPDLSFG